MKAKHASVYTTFSSSSKSHWCIYNSIETDKLCSTSFGQTMGEKDCKIIKTSILVAPFDPDDQFAPAYANSVFLSTYRSSVSSMHRLYLIFLVLVALLMYRHNKWGKCLHLYFSHVLTQITGQLDFIIAFT